MHYTEGRPSPTNLPDPSVFLVKISTPSALMVSSQPMVIQARYKSFVLYLILPLKVRGCLSVHSKGSLTHLDRYVSPFQISYAVVPGKDYNLTIPLKSNVPHKIDFLRLHRFS